MGVGIVWGALFKYVCFALIGGLGSYFAIGGAFEIAYYRRRDQAHAWKCQPHRWPSPRARRDEILLGGVNMTAASIASGALVYHISRGGCPTLYSSISEHGIPYAILSSIAYVLGTDLALYWAHRMFHTPLLYRAIHRVHHRWTSPTAFTAMAMHPIELFTYQAVMVAPFFLFPVPVYTVVATVLFTNYYALVDHSGVKARSWLPLIAPAQFHDDHHAHFHVNYGQTFALWDRLFGTHRRTGRRYGVEVFGGAGAPLGDDGPTPLWDYARAESDPPPAEAAAQAAQR